MAAPLTATFRASAGLPRGYVIDPKTGELVKGATQSVPTIPGSTNYPVLNQRPAWETGVAGNGVPSQQAGTGVGADGVPYYIDQYGKTWKLIGDQWIEAQETPTGLTTFTNGPASEMHKRLTSESTSFQDYLDYALRSAAEREVRPVLPPGHPQSRQAAERIAAQTPSGTQLTGGTPQPGDPSFQFDAENDWWQGAIKGGLAQADADYGAMVDRQHGIDNDAINSLTDLYRQQQDSAARANQFSTNLFGGYASAQGALNQQDQQALDHYLGEYDQNRSRVEGMTFDPVAFDPEGLGMQRDAYNWASGVAGGSLDYQAAQAQLERAAYQRANYERAQQTLAALERYASNPEDIARQKDAIERIRQDLDTGDAQQQEVYDEFKAHWRPEVTAEERFIAEQARRSFEAQDQSNREAVLQDMALRGVRSGSAEIASALANQQRFGQDRTMAELGLQANAVARAEANRANAGNMANAIRGANQQGLGLYVDATGQLRAMNDQVGMFNTDQANTQNRFNAGQANQISMFNADAYNQNQQFNANAYNQNQMFNAGQANQVNMFNAGQTNQARANNQSTRLAGGIQQGNMANQIRSANDAISMFNSAQSMAHQHWQAQELNNMSNSRLTNVTGTTSQMGSRNTNVFDAGRMANDDIYGRNREAISDGIGLAGTTHGVRTNTNALAGGRGQQNLGNILTAYPTFVTGANTSSNLRTQDRLRQQEMAGFDLLAKNNPKYRMT